MADKFFETGWTAFRPPVPPPSRNAFSVPDPTPSRISEAKPLTMQEAQNRNVNKAPDQSEHMMAAKHQHIKQER